MVALNSRINISNRGSGSTDDSTESAESNLEIRRSLPNTSHGDMMTLEETAASPEAHMLHVSMAIQSTSH